MVNIKLINNTGKPYSEVRDMICKHLQGNRGFIENDICVSDCDQDINQIYISLGSDNREPIELTGTIDKYYLK